MRLPISLSFAAALTAVGLLASPSMAAPLAAALPKEFAAQVQPAGDASMLQVQYRRGYRGGDRHRDRRRDRGDDGAGVAAGIFGGLLLGAIIANQAQQNRNVDYCVRRFRSYDPRSGTYLGNDGYRHRCP